MTRTTTIPKRCPVTFLHLCADNDVNGNPRRCFVVTDHQGRHVETLDEGYSGEGELQARYPWTSWHALHRLGFDEPSESTVYPQRVDVSPSEYKRALRREPDEGTERIRAMADRNQRREARREAQRREARR